MKIAIVIVFVLVGATGCTSDDHVEPAPVDCICGTFEADLEGCPCPACIGGEGNPSNPHCVCGGLHVVPDEEVPR